MNYYHELVTAKSWEELQRLKQAIDFVLIGGWAVYFYARALKSKDIDIIVDYNQLPILANNYRLNKNDRLHKYEAVKDEVEIDVYLPHMAQLGIPVEELIKHISLLDSFKILDINYLFVLKIHTLAQRGRTPKGKKDFLDLMALFISGKCNAAVITGLIAAHEFQVAAVFFAELINETTQIPELSLNSHKYSKTKKEMLAVITA